MKNWLGQDIEVGSIVYRGAREGNTSSYKVGRVLEVRPERAKVTVQWFGDGIGRPGVHTVVLIDPDTFDQRIRDRFNL